MAATTQAVAAEATGAGWIAALAATLALFGLKITIVLPAAIGAAVALFFFRQQMIGGAPLGLAGSFAVWGGGCSISAYSSEAMVDALDLANKARAEPAAAILIALVVMAAAAKVFQMLRDIDLKGIIEHRLKGSTSGTSNQGQKGEGG